MSIVLRLYRALVRLLPRAVRERDGEEMVHTLREQLADAAVPGRVAWRAFRRFPGVLALEWRDALFEESVPQPTARSRGSQMDAFVRLLRQGGRTLLRTPAFTLSVILLLGLGVGGVSAIFAVVDHVLLRQLPYPAAERLITVENGSHSLPVFRDLQAMPSIEAWSAVTSEEANLTGQGEPTRVLQATVTEGFFPMFGGRAQIGRMLGSDDFRRGQTVVLSYAAWQRLFGGERAVLGRTIHIDDQPLTVVGVVAGEFAPPEGMVNASVDVWRPLDPGFEYYDDRTHWAFTVAGRLRPGATLAEAERDAARVATDRAKAFPAAYTDGQGKPTPLPVVTLQEATIGQARTGLTLLFGAVTLLLLVACANVTHLFLARGFTRVHEMAVRRALGARTRALVAQLGVESVLLGLGGALVGVVLAQASVSGFLALIPGGLPRADAVRLDARVLLFAAGTGLLTALLFGLLPALHFAHGRLGNPLRRASRSVIGGRGAQAFRNGIVVMEVALSLVLVAQAGWLLRSFLRVSHEELGFRTAGVITLPMTVSGIEDPTEWNQRMEGVRESLARVPGVQQVAFGLSMPLEFTGGSFCCWGSRVEFTGSSQAEGPSMFHPVSDDYFTLLDLKLVAGRSWSRSRAGQQPYPAVLNEALAIERFGHAAAALGHTFALDSTTLEVVGVVQNNRHYGADQEYRTAVYLPARAILFSPGRVHMAVRTERADDALFGELRAAVWRVEPKVPVPIIRSLDEWSTASSAQRRFDSALVAAFGTIALLLAGGGLAGTLFYMVSLQRRELGIRLALGETTRGLGRVVLTRGIVMGAAGSLLGAAGAWATGRLVESRLFGVQARDLGTLGLAVALLMTLALVASWLPARRAAGTNPMESLRAE